MAVVDEQVRPIHRSTIRVFWRWVGHIDAGPDQLIVDVTTGLAVAEHLDLSPEDRAAEALFMGLRLTEGVDLEDFRNRYDVDVTARYGRELERLSDAGLIETGGGRLRLTSRGLVLSNEVFIAFV